jgi:hypothetical protein
MIYSTQRSQISDYHLAIKSRGLVYPRPLNRYKLMLSYLWILLAISTTARITTTPPITTHIHHLLAFDVSPPVEESAAVD